MAAGVNPPRPPSPTAKSSRFRLFHEGRKSAFDVRTCAVGTGSGSGRNGQRSSRAGPGTAGRSNGLVEGVCKRCGKLFLL